MVPPNSCPNLHYTAVELAVSQMSRRAPVGSSLCRSAMRQRSTREKRKQRFVVIVPFWPALSAAAIALAGTFTAYAPRKRWQDRGRIRFAHPRMNRSTASRGGFAILVALSLLPLLGNRARWSTGDGHAGRILERRSRAPSPRPSPKGRGRNFLLGLAFRRLKEHG